MRLPLIAYVKRGKTDAADAEAVCEAVTWPTMRFVPIKSSKQQAALSIHRTRDLLVKQRTQSINMIRGLLAKFGVNIPKRLERALLMARQIVEGTLRQFIRCTREPSTADILSVDRYVSKVPMSDIASRKEMSGVMPTIRPRRPAA